MKEAGTPEKIGKLNRRLILEYVRKHGPVSRADIRRGLGMSFPTVSANVKLLLEGSYLLEVGDGDNTIGRKSTLLAFNCRRVYVLGIDVGRSEIRVMLADLCGEELAYAKETNVDHGGSRQDVAAQLTRMVDAVVAQGAVQKSDVRCICIGIPGIRDRRSGKLRLAPFVRTLNIQDICDALAERYPSAMLLVDNSVNYGAIGEKWRGVAQDYRNILYINYGVGLGAALILNGELYQGVDNAAGEIGYMVPGREALRERFDEQGVLEALISGNRIVETLSTQKMDTNIRNLEHGTSQEKDLFASIERQIVETIGMVLINITAVFNEEIIVLGGGLGNLMGEKFLETWREMLQKHVPYVPRIETSRLQHRANILGAIAVAIRHVNDAEIEVVRAEE